MHGVNGAAVGRLAPAALVALRGRARRNAAAAAATPARAARGPGSGFGGRVAAPKKDAAKKPSKGTAPGPGFEEDAARPSTPADRCAVRKSSIPLHDALRCTARFLRCGAAATRARCMCVCAVRERAAVEVARWRGVHARR
jgi:hypothetical protein